MLSTTSLMNARFRVAVQSLGLGYSGGRCRRCYAALHEATMPAMGAANIRASITTYTILGFLVMPQNPILIIRAPGPYIKTVLGTRKL